MKIQKTIELKVEKTKRSIICSDLTTLSLVIGTKSCVGNLNVYNVKKVHNKYIVPIKFIKERIKQLENRVVKTNDYLDIMRQVVR